MLILTIAFSNSLINNADPLTPLELLNYYLTFAEMDRFIELNGFPDFNLDITKVM